MASRSKPVGVITRGTTNPNRLRRCDRWLVSTQRQRLTAPVQPPLVVDLGYGASPITTVELHDRLRAVRPDVRVLGLEIDPERVATAQPLRAPNLDFRLGGFEIDVPGRVDVVRAFNVLRQYEESEVAATWRRVQDRLTETGLFIEGTCDELGRLSTWVALDTERPLSLTLSWKLAGLTQPSVIAERLPKALIHRNVAGEPIHAFLGAIDRAWAQAAPHASFGHRQRFLAMTEQLAAEDWPLTSGRTRHRLGELSVAWDAVAPRAGGEAS